MILNKFNDIIHYVHNDMIFAFHDSEISLQFIAISFIQINIIRNSEYHCIEKRALYGYSFFYTGWGGRI